MSDLTDFLLARIAEDEADARPTVEDGLTDDERAAYFEQDLDAGALYWQANRTLRECEAKRTVVDHYLDLTTGDEEEAGAFWCEAHQIHHVLTWLAKIYRDHPDYREWVSPH